MEFIFGSPARGLNRVVDSTGDTAEQRGIRERVIVVAKVAANGRVQNVERIGRTSDNVKRQSYARYQVDDCRAKPCGVLVAVDAVDRLVNRLTNHIDGEVACNVAGMTAGRSHAIQPPGRAHPRPPRLCIRLVGSAYRIRRHVGRSGTIGMHTLPEVARSIAMHYSHDLALRMIGIEPVRAIAIL